jgi:uncharacterized protein (DUF58 family)
MKWWLGAAILLLTAIVIESSLLAYSMYVLLALLLLTRLFARTWINNLHARRKCKVHTAAIDEPISVNVWVENSGWMPIPWVLLEDLLPNRVLSQRPPRVKVQGKRLQIRMIRPQQKIAMPYELRFQYRGYYQIGPLVMESGDLFGLHRRFRVETEPHYVLVYPKIVPLEGYDLASRRPIGEVRMTYRLFEDPTRMSGVRHYEAGDPLNRVHWRATARTGELHSKIYEPSTLAGATLLLDFHQKGYPESGEPQRSELAITTAMALANAVYEMGQQVGFMTNGRDAADRIRLEGWEGDYRTRKTARSAPGMIDKSERLQPLVVPTRRGIEQFQRIRETLARVELTDGLTFAQLVSETAARLPRDATVVALLPHVSVETALMLGSLRRQGYAVTAVLILLNPDNLEKGYGRLVAEGVRDVRHLRDEAELPMLCQQQVEHAAPYLLITELV